MQFIHDFLTSGYTVRSSVYKFPIVSDREVMHILYAVAPIIYTVAHEYLISFNIVKHTSGSTTSIGKADYENDNV